MDVYDEQFLDVWRYPQVRAAGVRRLEPWQFSRVKSCLSSYVAIPCISDGTLPRCVLLGGTGQDFDGLEDSAHTCDGVGVGDHCRAEGVHGVAGTFPCVWTK